MISRHLPPPLPWGAPSSRQPQIEAMIEATLRGVDGPLMLPLRIGFIGGKDIDRDDEPYLMSVLVQASGVWGMIVWRGGDWAPATKARLGTARELAESIGAAHYLGGPDEAEQAGTGDGARLRGVREDGDGVPAGREAADD